MTWADGYTGKKTFSSADESIATVSDEGVITGLDAGKTNITIHADADGDFAEMSETFAITVTAVDHRQDPALSWNATSYAPYFDTDSKVFPTLSKADGFDQTITYSSSDESVATINAAGEITILKNGETTITAGFAGDASWTESSASYTLTVQQHISDHSFGETTAFTINLGDEFTAPTATVAPKMGKEYDGAITYSSSDESIAEVNETTGEVTLKGVAGTVTITATASETFAWKPATATYTLTIVDPNAPNDLFYESFDKCSCEGGNDGLWSGLSTNTPIKYDNPGWDAPKGNEANQCARFGNSSTAGNPTTPEIAFEAGKTYILTFKCAGWNKDNETPAINVSIVDGTATLTPKSISLVQGQWNDATITIENISGPAKINFTGNKRFFLDEVRDIEVRTSV